MANKDGETGRGGEAKRIAGLLPCMIYEGYYNSSEVG
jgi:hypothetical protein